MEEGGGDGAIDSAGHSDNDALWFHALLQSLPHPGSTTTELYSLDAEALAHKAVDVLSEHQALDIAFLDVSKDSLFTDYFVIATAQSPLQFNALVEHLEKALKPLGHDIERREGTPASGWVLLDFGAIMVHLFTDEQREFYRLEELWGQTSQVIRFAG